MQRTMAFVSCALALCVVVLAGGGCSSGPGDTGPTDTTPPAVTSHAPADGDDNVWVGVPIEAEFSEPIEPSSVSDATVRLAGPGSVALSTTLDLSSDGRTLTIATVGKLEPPTELTLALTSGIQDPAGNALAPQSWSWSLPGWLRRGTDPVIGGVNHVFIYGPYVAFGPDDLPVVGTNLETQPEAVVRRWDGNAWHDLPDLVGADGSAVIDALAVGDDGAPVVAWHGYATSGDPFDTFVSRLENGAWTILGGGLLLAPGSHYPDAADLTLDGGDAPVVAWSEKDTPGVAASDLYVARWTGSTWSRLGGKLEVNDGAAVEAVHLALDPQGDPVVAWGERFFDVTYVKHWNPTSVTWDLLGDPFAATLSTPPIVVLDDGTVAAATTESGRLQVKRYGVTGWQPLGAALLRNPGWNANPGWIGIASNGDVLVCWNEFTPGSSAVYVARRTNGAWEAVGEPVEASDPVFAGNPRLALDSADVPSLAYTTTQSLPAPDFGYRVETIFRTLNR